MSKASAITIIRNDEDAEKFRQDLQNEMGKTDAEYWMKTDPNTPPFKIGDKVMVEHVSGNIEMDAEMIRLVREVQTVSHLMPIPCSHANIWSIELEGCVLGFVEKDLKKVYPVVKSNGNIFRI